MWIKQKRHTCGRGDLEGMKAVIIGTVIQTARPFGRIAALLFFASLAVSTHASSEYLLPATGFLPEQNNARPSKVVRHPL